MAINILVSIALFIAFIPGLFFTLPQCSKDKTDNINKWTIYITHAVLFSLALAYSSLF